jgi:hypothetical protein
MMNSLEARAHKLLMERWNAAFEALDSLSLQAIPQDAHSIFSLTSDRPKVQGVVGFTINPVTFVVPEDASNTTSNLYINVLGWINLEEASAKKGVLRTVGFGTEAAYFRSKGNSLRHVFGVHHDFSLNEVGHPMFHSQIRSYKKREAQVVAKFPHTCTDDDPFKDVLKTVRVPTAQMDFFALLVQICADHLIDKYSSTTQLNYFASVRNASSPILGSAELLTRLDAAQCVRGGHWYT